MWVLLECRERDQRRCGELVIKERIAFLVGSRAMPCVGEECEFFFRCVLVGH